MAKKSRKIKKYRKNGKKKQKNKTLIILFILALFFVAVALIMPRLLILETQIIKAEINVSSSTGFNVNNSYLIFGRIMPGDSSSRIIYFTNTYDVPIVVDIVPRGEISSFIVRQKVYFIPGEEKEMTISASVPKNAVYGMYSGDVLFVVRKTLSFGF